MSNVELQGCHGNALDFVPHGKITDFLIEQYHGRFVASAADSVLGEFSSVVNAVECAGEIQTALKAESLSLTHGHRMHFRIEVNLGDVMVEVGQIYTDEVNVAARLESLAGRRHQVTARKNE